MRFAGLLALAVLLPVSAQAENPPALTAYTISHDTIYPAATSESNLATTTAIDIAFSEPVKASIKIRASSGAIVKSLYTSSSVTNPAPKIWDGTNTAGTPVDAGTYTVLIAATSTSTSLAMSDSSKTVVVALVPSDSGTSDTDLSSDTADPQPPASSGSGTPEYLPIPTLHLIESVPRTVSSGADVAFSAVVYDGRGNKRDDVVVTWSFGDGMRRVGASVYHQYYSPGEYLAVVRATTPDGGAVQEEVIMTVKDASIRISAVSARGIALTNRDTRTLDLSLWRVVSGGQEFRIPEDTHILAGRTIFFSPHVTGLPVAETASLLYPSGEVAASYPETPVMRAETSAQPPAPVVSYKQVQKVEPITSTRTDVQSYEETGLAPTAATELAAVGAALPESSSSPAAGVFKSPWTLGLLGVMATAAAAFILL